MATVEDNDDDSITAYWRDVKAASQEKRAGNRESSATILRNRGIPFESKNWDAHLIVKPQGSDEVIDFWPGTGRWIVRSTKHKGFGVFNLLKHIEE